MTEKVSRYGRHAAILAAGGLVVYAGLIVFLGGLGLGLAFYTKKLGIDPMFANFIGLGTVGLLVILVGAIMVFKAVKAFSAESRTPQRFVETLQHLKGTKPARQESLGKEKTTKLSLKDLQTEVLATEDRIEKELKEIAYRTSPEKIKEDAIEHLLNHPSQWGLVALGSGLIGSFLISRKLRSEKPERA